MKAGSPPAHRDRGFAGRLGALRHREFRLLWVATATSAIGNRLVTVAMALFVIELTGSATDLGLVLAAQAVPLIGFLLLGGVWADRLPRNAVMVVSDVVRFGLHALLAVLIFTDAVEIWHLIVIEALFGTAEAFFRPASSGLVPQTVPEDELQEANALVGLVNHAAEFVGPALATALVLGLGAGTAFALDALTFLLSAACLVRIRPRARGVRAAAGGEPANLRTDLREGFDAVRSRPWVWVTIAAFSGGLLLCLAPTLVLGPLVAQERYGSIGVYGVITAALGAGTIAGSLLGMRWRPRRPLRTGMALTLLWPVSAAAFALGAPLPVAVILAALDGMNVALFDVWWFTALAQRIPPHLLSRVTAFDWMGSLGLAPLGYVLAGPLGERFGASEVLLGGSLLAALCLACGLLPRQTRELEWLDAAHGVNAPATTV